MEIPESITEFHELRKDICDARLPCGHRCEDKDYGYTERCRPCSVQVEATKACGMHSTTLSCSEKLEYASFPCEFICSSAASCSHPCELQGNCHTGDCVCDRPNCTEEGGTPNELMLELEKCATKLADREDTIEAMKKLHADIYVQLHRAAKQAKTKLKDKSVGSKEERIRADDEQKKMLKVAELDFNELLGKAVKIEESFRRLVDNMQGYKIKYYFS